MPSVLSEAEQARLQTYTHEARRIGFVLGRTAARTLLADELGLDAQAVPFGVGEDGAPEVPGHGLYVSIAHVGTDLGGAALAHRPVGLDLERIRPRHPDLWRRMLTPAEHSVLEALGGPTDEVQTLLWSLKEAVLKARRTGLRAGLRSVRLLHLGSAEGTAMAEDGTEWMLGFEQRDALWVSWAVRSDQAST